jgi:hypothetical protein
MYLLIKFPLAVHHYNQQLLLDAHSEQSRNRFRAVFMDYQPGGIPKKKMGDPQVTMAFNTLSHGVMVSWSILR